MRLPGTRGAFLRRLAAVGCIAAIAARPEVVLCIHADGDPRLEPTSFACCEPVDEGCGDEGCVDCDGQGASPCGDCDDYSLSSLSPTNSQDGDPILEAAEAGGPTAILFPEPPARTIPGTLDERPPAGTLSHLRTVVLLL
jgi:hypothetical protein